MHPLLTNRTWLAIYMATWTLPLVLLVITFVVRGGLSWAQASALGAPLALVFALLGLPVYYVCRANPLVGSQYYRSLAAHGVAALVYGGLWQVAAKVQTSTLERVYEDWLGLSDRVWSLAPLLFGLGMLFYLLVAAGYYLFFSIQAARRSERREADLQVQASGAELRALQAQVNPHFLFNSLHSVSALISREPDKAQQATIRLADFLRMTLGLGQRLSISLDDELKMTDHYLAVEQIRLGSRLRVDRQVDPDCRTLLVPPLTLQPLVENAVLHGIATLSEGGTVHITARRDGGELILAVDNPFDPQAPKRPGTGTGLRNLRSRLATQFEREARLDSSTDGDHFRVRISLPAVRGVQS